VFFKAHRKITPRGKSKGCLGLGELPKIFGFPYNISATAGASEFQFAFARTHRKITCRRKGGHGPGLGELLKIWGFLSIFTMAEASDFKFITQLGFAKAHHKTTPRGKVGVALVQGNAHILGIPL